MNIDEVMEHLCVIKRAVCAREHGATQLQPIVEVYWPDGSKRHVTIGEREGIGDAVRLLRATGTDPIAGLAFCADALLKVADTGTIAQAASMRGKLQQLLAAGDMTVKNALLVTLFARDGSARSAVRPYGYTDDGIPRFEAIIVDLPLIDGDVPRVIRKALA